MDECLPCYNGPNYIQIPVQQYNLPLFNIHPPFIPHGVYIVALELPTIAPFTRTPPPHSRTPLGAPADQG